jgi:hypothetical protein
MRRASLLPTRFKVLGLLLLASASATPQAMPAPVAYRPRHQVPQPPSVSPNHALSAGSVPGCLGSGEARHQHRDGRSAQGAPRHGQGLCGAHHSGASLPCQEPAHPEGNPSGRDLRPNQRSYHRQTAEQVNARNASLAGCPGRPKPCKCMFSCFASHGKTDRVVRSPRISSTLVLLRETPRTATKARRRQEP